MEAVVRWLFGVAKRSVVGCLGGGGWCSKFGRMTVAGGVGVVVARVRRRGDRPPSRKNSKYFIPGKMGRDKEFLSLQVKIWTGSRHLIFWLPNGLVTNQPSFSLQNVN